MRKIRANRLTKRSRNARVIAWVIRTGKPIAFTNRDGTVQSILAPINGPLEEYYRLQRVHAHTQWNELKAARINEGH